MKRLAALLAPVGLAGCMAGSAPPQEAVQYGQLPPITRSYQTQIATWSRHFYGDPGALAETRLSDPRLIRDSTGRLLWLVCLSAQRVGGAGLAPGPQIQAFGFAPDYFSGPLERRGSSLTAETCGQYPLTYRPVRLVAETTVTRRRRPS